MTQKEIIKIVDGPIEELDSDVPLINELISEDPEISYTQISNSEEPWLVRMLISSRPPTETPFFIAFVDGKITGSVSGHASKDQLKDLFN
jgi:hypothetical protein